MTYYILSIVDFGLLILAGLVQFIIYPSFQHMDHVKLNSWHQRYQLLISYFVLPLMLTELGLSFYHLLHAQTWLNTIHLSLVAIIWLSTFLQAVPVHQAISAAEHVPLSLLKKLVKVNILRTLLWVAVFLISFYHVIENFQN